MVKEYGNAASEAAIAGFDRQRDFSYNNNAEIKIKNGGITDEIEAAARLGSDFAVRS